MTETSPVSTQTRVDDEFDLVAPSAGLPPLEIKVADPVTGEPVPAARPAVPHQGLHVMLGYREEPEKTWRPSRTAG